MRCDPDSYLFSELQIQDTSAKVAILLSSPVTTLSNEPQFYNVNGVRLAVFERPGDGPPILFVHATGFHARCWNQVVARIPEWRCIAVEHARARPQLETRPSLFLE